MLNKHQYADKASEITFIYLAFGLRWKIKQINSATHTHSHAYHKIIYRDEDKRNF